VHPPAKLVLDGTQLRPLAIAPRAALQQEAAAPRAAADVREAKKIERLRLALPGVLPLGGRVAAEADQPGLAWMQAQRKLRQSRLQIRPEPLGIGLVLEADDQIVGRSAPG
jgi:hypothetical protein